MVEAPILNSSLMASLYARLEGKFPAICSNKTKVTPLIVLPGGQAGKEEWKFHQFRWIISLVEIKESNTCEFLIVSLPTHRIHMNVQRLFFAIATAVQFHWIWIYIGLP